MGLICRFWTTAALSVANIEIVRAKGSSLTPALNGVSPFKARKRVGIWMTPAVVGVPTKKKVLQALSVGGI